MERNDYIISSNPVPNQHQTVYDEDEIELEIVYGQHKVRNEWKQNVLRDQRKTNRKSGQNVAPLYYRAGGRGRAKILN